MKKKKYNWHFWIPELKIQVIIEDCSYGSALNKIKDTFHRNYLHTDNYDIKFQFGQKI